MSRIFISYAHEDRDAALQLYRDLRQEGLDPWLDQENLLGGQDWEVEVGKAIRSSSYFLALISEKSISKRGYVQRELRDAMEVLRQVPPGQIYLVPIRLDKTEPLHEELKGLHWIDLFPSYPEGFRRLLKSLRAGSGQDIRPPAPSPDERHSIFAPAPESLAVSRSRSERDFPESLSTSRSPASGAPSVQRYLQETPAANVDNSDECTYDENGICDNQKHWGANE